MPYVVYKPIWEKGTRVPKGVVIYYHSTLFGIKQVPTSAESLLSEIFILASMYANNGYIFVVPNYIGYDSNSTVHPYLTYPGQNLQSGIQCLN